LPEAPVEGGFGACLHDFFEFLLECGGPLLHELEGLQVFQKLFEAGSADQGHTHVLVHQRPSQTQLRLCAANLFGESSEGDHPFEELILPAFDVSRTYEFGIS
jgi:hypothetical protein